MAKTNDSAQIRWNRRHKAKMREINKKYYQKRKKFKYLAELYIKEHSDKTKSVVSLSNQAFSKVNAIQKLFKLSNPSEAINKVFQFVMPYLQSHNLYNSFNNFCNQYNHHLKIQ